MIQMHSQFGMSSKSALLIVDMQEYFCIPSCDEEGKTWLYSVCLPKVISNTSLILNAFRNLRDDAHSQNSFLQVIFTYYEALNNDGKDIDQYYQIHPPKASDPDLSQIPKPYRPANFLDILRPSKSKGRGDILFQHTSPGKLFDKTGLSRLLQNLHVENIILCGYSKDYEIENTALEAARLGFSVTIVTDAYTMKSEEEIFSPRLGNVGNLAVRLCSTKDILEQLEKYPEELFSIQAEEQSLIKITPVTSFWNEPIDKHAISGPIYALLHTLKGSGVDLIRYACLDVNNAIRAKVVPLDRLLPVYETDPSIVNKAVSIALVCMAGLPSLADCMIPESGVDAKHIVNVIPDWKTLKILPYATKSAMVMGTVHDPVSGLMSVFCTRGLLKRVLNTAKDTLSIGFNIGVEIEFVLCKQLSSSQGDSIVPVDSSLFAHTTTLNEQKDFISDLYSMLKSQGIVIELVHAESASGQMEVVISYDYDVMRLADNLVYTRETIRACAKNHEMRAIFLPKISTSEAGNGMHIHMSLREHSENAKHHKNVFVDSDCSGAISAVGKSFMEGILQHLGALMSISMASSNSFLRMGPGCWTGYKACWGIEDKEVPLRVCQDPCTGASTHFEIKLSDSTANFYLEVATIIAAGIDGIARKLKLRPMNVAGLDHESSTLPSSLKAALECLEKDEYLMNCMGEKLARSYLAVKRKDIEVWETWTLKDELLMAYRKA